ncbi:hypothetical protein CAEBREN_23471 [Caenorhabditis brenneri]|uniref:Uncharacterized protein n=1 Tax=Caenorhabditis brenneri TaxID=135651 RepID=G0MLQ4_CAEBE|nr:hypothetical protein CAEBREN_23471 [Caenorhabditis brenneri]
MEMFRFDSILADMSSSSEPTIMGVQHKELASEKVQREMGIKGFTVGEK